MLQGFATARGAKRTGRTEPSAPTDGTSYPKGICSAALHCRTPSPTARSAVIARSEATRQSVLPLPPSAREVAARSADRGRGKRRRFLSPSRLRRQPPPRGSLAARRCRANGGGAMWASPPYEMTCRAGPMCPAAKDTFFPAGHAGPALRGARVLGGQSRPPLQVGHHTPVRAYSHVRSHNCPRLGRSSGRPA